MSEIGDWSRVIRGELYERWPKDENGVPEEPVHLVTADNINMSDEVTVNMRHTVPHGLSRGRELRQAHPRRERAGHRYPCPEEQGGGGRRPLQLPGRLRHGKLKRKTRKRGDHYVQTI